MARHEKLSIGTLDVSTITGGGGFLNQFPGKKVYVDPVNGSDGNSGLAPAQAKKTFSAGYAMLTTNKNDCLVIIGGASALTQTEAITWSKSYTHLFGVVAPVQYGIRNRIRTVTTALTPFFTLSGNGCIISGVMIEEAGSHATNSAVALKISGARNYLEHVHARTMGALAVVDASKRDLVMYSSDGENYFYKCVFGTDTYDGSANAANYVMEFNGALQQARNTWEDCLFLGSGSSGASFILATTTSSLSSFNFFKRCKFINNDHGSMNAMTQGFNLGADAGGHLIFEDCLVYGAATLETSNTGLIMVRNAPAAATGDILIAATF